MWCFMVSRLSTLSVAVHLTNREAGLACVCFMVSRLSTLSVAVHLTNREAGLECGVSWFLGSVLCRRQTI